MVALHHKWAITPFRVKAGFIAQAHAKKKEKKGKKRV
jgi:hypothetical protein